MAYRFLALAIVLLFFQACTPRQMVLRMASPLFEGQVAALNEEPDPKLAESAIPASLKMMEGLVKADPENASYHHKLAEGFCGYAFSFVEGNDNRRASDLYLRGRNHAVRSLILNGAPENLLQLPPDEFKSALENLDRETLPGLFWTGQCWGAWLMFNLTDIEALAAFPKVEAVMRRVLEWDETFHFAGPHLFFGGFYGARSPMLGGKPEQARQHFERALELTEHKYLIIQVMYAKTLAVQTQDKELYTRLLDEVVETPEGVLPGQRLANEVARLKAKQLLEDVDVLF
ncbi:MULTISPECIES: TRAP transporter TatT component family protein [unclassified Nitrospina]|uniref:TRAP transporter TatT component family protein n=1 Tax=unclassified Nitrospina TaxID=2638683 RepID=UPI003F98D4C7